MDVGNGYITRRTHVGLTHFRLALDRVAVAVNGQVLVDDDAAGCEAHAVVSQQGDGGTGVCTRYSFLKGGGVLGNTAFHKRGHAGRIHRIIYGEVGHFEGGLAVAQCYVGDFCQVAIIVQEHTRRTCTGPGDADRGIPGSITAIDRSTIRRHVDGDGLGVIAVIRDGDTDADRIRARIGIDRTCRVGVKGHRSAVDYDLSWSIVLEGACRDFRLRGSFVSHRDDSGSAGIVNHDRWGDRCISESVGHGAERILLVRIIRVPDAQLYREGHAGIGIIHIKDATGELLNNRTNIAQSEVIIKPHAANQRNFRICGNSFRVHKGHRSAILICFIEAA